ncbi:NAD(P)-dependent oxidoreductase [Tomitella gaofuii]|uniref:NAD(P)-dependent oxidoreductase n=1 Tax=Tomitella gaofuii TaxID=2760083 RepID=UPI0015F8F5AF|nr:NAD(P)-dependent oxidoreductase [Tomitella gaofuii]
MTAAPRVLSHVGDLPRFRETMRAEGLDVEVTPIPQDGPIDPAAGGEVLLTPAQVAPNLDAVLARGVRWVHTVGTGIDTFSLGILDGRPLTVSRGATSVPIAEWVMAQILTAEKNLPQSWVTAPPERWGGAELGSLDGATVAILGLGATGIALAERALPFGAHVRALRRSGAPSPVAGVQVVRDTAELVDGADHVVLAAPLTADTAGIVDAGFLRRMKPGAHLINVARSGLVVDDDLKAALDSGALGLASLDVAPTEPLPAGHWYYRHPRVRFSPHSSWSGRGVWESIVDSFTGNYRRYAAGRQLEDVVDVSLGY